MVTTYSLKKDGEISLSKNFKVKEFRCKDGADEVKIDLALIPYLQAIRDWAGASVTINSAYRTPRHNRIVGGATNSNHVKGMACDIVVKGKTVNEVAQFAETLGLKGIIRYNTFVHIDTRTKKYYAINNNGKITVKTTFR